ncbi:hypothetical protein E2L08_02525 [Palleronia sediminis]|uniref:Uncharacterized protein n=1 Tax=Palleronia sediminis TaxID=2547833 RepID=A0A4R6ALY0_9RHOB|nr:hypothetical protein [Palleronia sediminis]TDL83538.1 hypothetical protein E2L08_02525 [Palleronia sediminis]
MRFDRLAAPALALALITAPAAGDERRPVIDWLSDSVETPRPVAPRDGDVASNAMPRPVAVSRLDAPTPDLLGLAGPLVDTLPRPLWSRSEMEALRPRLAAIRPAQLTAMQRLVTAMLVAPSAPPAGSDGMAMYLARVDALLGLGELDQARALLARAEIDGPETFRRWFDIAILTGTENTACRRMRLLPEITPTLPARIFCLARTGDWPAAALTLETARALDVIEPALANRLTRFLDDFAGGVPLAPPASPSPLDYALYEAIGEPLRSASLPIAFAHADLRDNVGWRARIEAAERLARAGAIGPERLWSVYQERLPAASGGVWDRVNAIQRFETAMRARDPAAVAGVLPDAWDQMGAADLRPIFAERYGAGLLRLPLEGAAERIALRAAMLSGGEERLRATETAARREPELAALARGQDKAIADPTPEIAAILRGLRAEDLTQDNRRLIEDDRLGEALLEAAELLDEGAGGNLDAVTEGLSLLVALGLRDTAIDAALELAILGMQP